MMRIFILCVALLGLPFKTAAEEISAEVLLERLSNRVPGTMLLSLRKDPEHFFEEAAGVVLGYGARGEIDASGLEDAVQAGRARVRAREMRRLLSVDLNDDLRVDARELQVALATSSATMRGRLLGWHRAADTNKDDIASFDELRAWAAVQAQYALSDQKADAMRGLMIFDIDQNGFVSLGELESAVAALEPSI